MIGKSALRKKAVAFIDKNHQYRIATVVKIQGRTLSVATITKMGKKRYRLYKERIHPDKNVIHGVYYRNRLVEIDWGQGK